MNKHLISTFKSRHFIFYLMLIFVGIVFESPAAEVELLSNRGFESGVASSWSRNGDSGILEGDYPRSGDWYGYLGNVNDAIGSVHQFIDIPANATSATLTFYLNIKTYETGAGTTFDKMDINFRDAVSDSLLKKWKTYSESDKGSNVDGQYTQMTITFSSSDLSSYKGQTVLLQFYGTTDYADKTLFRIDDVSFKATTDDTPLAPSLLETIAYDDHIQLAWADNSTNETGFKIERKVNNGSFSQLTTVGANADSDVFYTDNSVSGCNIYTYRVRAYNDDGNSTYSTEAVNFLRPAVPSNLVATPNASTINLSWQDNACNEDGIKLDRKAGANGTWDQIGDFAPNTVGVIDNSAQLGILYYYRVYAYNYSGNSSYSSAVSASIQEQPTTYTLSISATHGSVAKDPDQANYAMGSQVILTPIPSANYIFSGWSGDASGTGQPKTVTMNANKSITASFISAPTSVPIGTSIGGPLSGSTPVSITIPLLQSVYLLLIQISKDGIHWFTHDAVVSNGAITSPTLPTFPPGQIAMCRLGMTVPQSEPGFLKFPIKGFTDPYTVPISAIFDLDESNPNKPASMRTYRNEQVGDEFSVESGQSASLKGFKKDAIGTSFDLEFASDKSILWYDDHTGYDYPATKSSEIIAAADGDIDRIATGTQSTWNGICIVHDNGYRTFYLHLSKWADKIQNNINGTEKIHVTQGETIGWAGNVGVPGATGDEYVHLHFTVKNPQQQRVDPHGEFSRTGVKIKSILWQVHP